MLTIKWRYESDNWHEYITEDSAIAGQIFRLKVLEPKIMEVNLCRDDVLIIRYVKEDEED
jgi:hypothetical protein